MSATSLRKVGVYVLIAVPALGLGGIAVTSARQDPSAQQGGDAVADAARKAREQKKSEPKPKKVFTNDDVPSGSSTAQASSAPSNPSTGETKESAAAAEANVTAGNAKDSAPKNDEATWRKRFADTRAELAQTEKELDILQREAQKAQVQYYSDPNKAMKEQYSRTEVNDKDTKIAAKKQEIDQLKQKLSAMEDELRRSGGDIGWARE